MQKKAIAIVITILSVLGTLSPVYLFKSTLASPLDMKVDCRGTVDKRPCESFIIKITFKNKGSAEGEWETAVTFEGHDWIWKGEKKLLNLKPYEKKILDWEGDVPEDAAVDSVARLIAYHDNDFVALNWWIHVIPSAELHIINSIVN